MNCECNNNSNRVEPRIKHVYGNVLRMAIPLTLRTLVKDGDEMIVNDTDFIPSSDHLVRVVFSKGKTNYPIIATMDGNVAIIEDKGKIPVGTYDISVECYDDLGNPYRFKQNAVLYVTDTTAEAGIDEEIEYEAQTWYLNAAVFLATTEIGEIGDVIDAKLDDVFGNAVYDANAKEIRFYNKDNSRVLASIDATPFTADGSVEDVYIDVGRQVLVVVNNDAAGGTRFSVPLYLVFAEYYKKDEVDSLVSRTVENVRLDFSQELPLVVSVTKNGSSISSSIDYGTIDNAIREDGRLVVACVNNAKFYQLSGVNGMEVVFSRVDALDGYQELLIVNESNVWSMEDVDLGTGGGGGGYEPPVGGIPKKDLSQSVQDTLDSVANKVDKESGKGLSTEDFTAALKAKLEALDPYTKAQVDAAIQEAVEGLGGGSVESVTINGVNHTPNNGIVDLGTVVGQQGPQGNVAITDAGQIVTIIENNLDSSDGNAILSARQGKILKQAVDRVQANLQAVVDALANMAFTSAKPTLSQIDWTGGTFYATISKTLNGCTTQNMNTEQVAEGQQFTMILSALTGYTLTGAVISVTNSKGQSVAYTFDNNTNTITIAAANVVGTINISVAAKAIHQISLGSGSSNVAFASGTATEAVDGSSWTGTIEAASGYKLPASINVTMGGNPVTPTYNSTSGAITIANVTGNIVITAVAEEVGMINIQYNTDKWRKTPAVTQVSEGVQSSITIEPMDTFILAEVKYSVDGGQEQTATIVDNATTFNVTANTSVVINTKTVMDIKLAAAASYTDAENSTRLHASSAGQGSLRIMSHIPIQAIQAGDSIAYTHQATTTDPLASMGVNFYNQEKNLVNGWSAKTATERVIDVDSGNNVIGTVFMRASFRYTDAVYNESDGTWYNPDGSVNAKETTFGDRKVTINGVDVISEADIAAAIDYATTNAN